MNDDDAKTEILSDTETMPSDPKDSDSPIDFNSRRIQEQKRENRRVRVVIEGQGKRRNSQVQNSEARRLRELVGVLSRQLAQERALRDQAEQRLRQLEEVVKNIYEREAERIKAEAAGLAAEFRARDQARAEAHMELEWERIFNGNDLAQEEQLFQMQQVGTSSDSTTLCTGDKAVHYM